MYDQYKRKIEYVRISLTDRCNLRCRYCMPEEGIEKMRHEDILTFDEIIRIVRGLAALGVRKVRLTGGEPLVRRNIVELVREIHKIEGIRQIALTTNGVLLANLADELVKAGLTGVNISIDTLKAATFADITRRPVFARVEAGIEAVHEAGLRDVKFNCVPIQGVNEAELPALVEHFTHLRPWKFRFIELMPIGCAYEAGLKGIPMAEVRQTLENAFGRLRPVPAASGVCGPAAYYQAAGFRGQVGFIDAMEHKFCSSCNRVRLTAEGFLKLCLNAKTGLDLRSLLRSGISDENLRLALQQAIYHKPEEHFFKTAAYQEKDSRAMYQVGG
ncbi:GTP 3',8-cyclase MoaA [Mitsuokella sp.]|uniref:GTP 3',8-cyclase MoaA n=1 Tax=Mitsuokella sp. TaxID=2049034 RepID=UPI003D7C676A